MKALILGILLSISCSYVSAQTNKADTLVGSRWDNINNSKYSVMQFHVDGSLCFATINQYFRDYSEKQSFPFSLFVTIELLDKNVNGHPTSSEADLLNQMEDSLIRQFVSTTPFCYIGRTTLNGSRELIFYVADQNKATEVMKRFIKHSRFNRKTKFSIESDRTWDAVSGLYPEV